MSDHHGQLPEPPPAAGRHRGPYPNSRHRILTTAAIVSPLVVAAALIVLFLTSGVMTDTATADSNKAADSKANPTLNHPASTHTAASCPLSGGRLTVTASPEIAQAIRRIADSLHDPGATTSACTVEVTAKDAADFLNSLQSSDAHRPDVWIPDSSLWVRKAADAGATVLTPPTSIAGSPVVLALSPSAARSAQVGPTTADATQKVLASRSTPHPVRIGLPEPNRSASAVAALAQIRAQLSTEPDGRAAITWAMRSTPTGLPTDARQLLSRLADDPNTAVPVTEQAVFAHNQSANGVDAVATYLPAGGAQLDYPYVVMTSDTSTAAAAADLLAHVTSETGRQLLADDGFRDANGHARRPLSNAAGVDPSDRHDAVVSSPSILKDVTRSVVISNQPSRTLAILDVSGSMSAEAPGTDETRLDLAKDAAQRGLALYPPDSEIGLWIFSRTLTADTDYREVVPIGPLTQKENGITGDKRIAEALDTVQVNPDGGTGLYDTTLSAVRLMRARWDPQRVNTVLILSDGENDDQGSISLPDLLTTLTAEQNPGHPVPVITIAFGPESDVDAMEQISKTTGGASYVARNPADVGEIFLDAVGQRLCRPNC